MNFDFSWFLTIPGMLITGGVLLLIVALIILIVSGKKSKKENKDVNEVTSQPIDNTVVNSNMSSAINEPVQQIAPPYISWCSGSKFIFGTTGLTPP